MSIQFGHSMNIKVISIIVLSSFIAISACAGIKETNPSSPQFDESKFQFEDYAGFDEFRDAMEAMFPVGTSRQKIEHVLVNVGGAKIFVADKFVQNPPIEESEKMARYIKPSKSGMYKCHFRVRAIYDNYDKLSKKIDAYYGCTGP
ncbi:MAG: hypothetical protein AB7D00_09835 [Rhodospirillaceae bacterium]